jgi:hypothetical protein
MQTFGATRADTQFENALRTRAFLPSSITLWAMEDRQKMLELEHLEAMATWCGLGSDVAVSDQLQVMVTTNWGGPARGARCVAATDVGGLSGCLCREAPTRVDRSTQTVHAGEENVLCGRQHAATVVQVLSG